MPPAWWQGGWRRPPIGSVKEVELLSQLAAVLMPQTPVGELFRSFPSPDGETILKPSLTAHGVLKDPQAALFVVYDCTGNGKGMESKLKRALLAYGPLGSHILYIGHKESRPLEEKVLCVKVRDWKTGDRASLLEVLADLSRQVSLGFGPICPGVFGQLQCKEDPLFKSDTGDWDYLKIVNVLRCETARQEIKHFLNEKGFSLSSIKRLQKCALLSGKCTGAKLQSKFQLLVNSNLRPSQAAEAVATGFIAFGSNFDENLRVTQQWLLDMGLSPRQAANALTTFPSIFCRSAEQKLVLMVKWLLDLGFAPKQIVKVIGCCPQVLSRSVEWNSKNVQRLVDPVGLTRGQVVKVVAGCPDILSNDVSDTMQWFLDFGFTPPQIAKLIASYPRVLACDSEQSLKVKVQWLLELGMAKKQVVKVIVAYPQILGLSIDGKLDPKVQWFLDVGLQLKQVASAMTKSPKHFFFNTTTSSKPKVEWLLGLGLNQNQVAKAISDFPRLLSLSVQQNLKPKVKWLVELGLTKDQIVKVVVVFPQILGLSIERNLVPKLQWLGQLGLREDQVVKFISSYPLVFKYSIGTNLAHKQVLLQRVFGEVGAVEIILKQPSVLGTSYQRLSTRLEVLVARNETMKLPRASRMTEEQFQARYLL